MPDPAKNKPHIFAGPLRKALLQIGMGDLVLLVYIVTFVRQYFWVIHNSVIAWIITILVSLLFFLIHLRTNDVRHRLPGHFYLIIALPLLAIFLLRFAFPDISFDVLDYRVISGERALRGAPFLDGDFFPSRFPFNPAPDMVTGIGRHIFGYRLGTIINYAVLLWVASILDSLLYAFIKNSWLRYFGILVLLLTEQALFLFSNYMVDLLALPLLLEATALVLMLRESKNLSRALIRLGIYLGASIAFKLTNLAFAIPILLVCGYQLFASSSAKNLVKSGLIALASLLAPLLPFTLFIYLQTGNPVFPLYNKIFRSPFWPTTDFAGVRWGPIVDDPRWANMHWWEVLLWPILLPFKIEHTAGDLGPDTGRLLIGFVTALALVVVLKKEKRVRQLALITVLGAVLWSVISGMARYAIFLNVIGGMLVLYVATQTLQLRLGWRRVVPVIIWVVLVAQSVIACFYASRFDWSARPTFIDEPRAYRRDARYLLKDYNLSDFLSPRERELIRPVDAWIEGSALDSAIQVQLKPDIPAVCVYMPEFFGTEESKDKFHDSMQRLADRNVFALVRTEHFAEALKNITSAGLRVGEIHQLAIPYFSEHTRIHMALMRISRSQEQSEGIRITESIVPLERASMQAEIVWSLQPPTTLVRGSKITVYLKVKNVGSGVWPALPASDGSLRIAIANHWLSKSENVVTNDDGRGILTYDIKPQEVFELPLTITVPVVAGEYVLEIDLVQEGVSWFSAKGSKTLKTRVVVEG